jgi:hypothetical protein
MAFACQCPQTREECIALYDHENRREATAAFLQKFVHYNIRWQNLDTYDHRSVKTGHPVRSAIHKH